MAKATANPGNNAKGKSLGLSKTAPNADTNAQDGASSSSRVSAPRKRRVQKRAEETTGKIRLAATRLFSERGYDGATIRDIENAAGVKRGLVSHHFGTKEKLWKAILEQIFGLLREYLDARTEQLKGLPPSRQAAQVIGSYVRFNAAHPELTRLMVHEGKRDTARLRFIVDTYSRPLMKQLRQSVGVWIDADNEDFVFWYYTFLGAGSLVYTMAPEAQSMFGFDAKDPSNVDRHADFVADFLVHRGVDKLMAAQQAPAKKNGKKTQK